MRAFLLFVILFTATLRSWYFFGWGFSADNFVLPAIALFALMWPRDLRRFPQISMLVACSVLIALAGGLVVTAQAPSDLVKIETPLSIAVFAVCGLLSSGIAARESWSHDIATALKCAILIHAAFLFIQLVALLVFDQRLDFHVLVTGEESRNEGGALDNFGLGFFFRPSGLLNEPGTYSAWLLPMIALYMSVRDYRSDWTTVLGLLSVFATFSSQGVISAVVVCMVLLWRNRGILSLLITPLFVIVAFATISLAVWQRFVMGNYMEDNSAVTRLSSVESAFTTVLGNGFLFPTISIGDNTTIVYWWWYCGIFAIPVLLSFGLLALRYWYSIALVFFVLLTSKVPASSPFYWLIIGLSIGQALRRENYQTAVPRSAALQTTMIAGPG